MTFAELKQELLDRGFSDLDTTRAGRYINAARAELDRLYLWPWRESSVVGSPPLAITDLGPIEAVVDTSANDEPLRGFQYRDLLNMYADLSLTGSPFAYYVARPSGTPVVATYPTGDSIGVQYWKVTPDLTGTQTPASPTEAHMLIVDMAVQRVYRDQDAHELAGALQQEVDRQLDALVMAYPPGIADDPGLYLGPGWDLS